MPITLKDSYWVDTSKYQGKLNGSLIKARGWTGVIGRSTIGVAPRDPQYEATANTCADNGLELVAYGVNWPSNRNPEAEAEVFVEHSFDPRLPIQPSFLAGDFELGLSKHSSGHHLLSGGELVDQALHYMAKLEELVPEIPLVLYTGIWYWNSRKLLPYIGQGEDKYLGWFAFYPYDPRQLPGLPPRHSADVLDPREINPNALDYFVTKIPKPWKLDTTAGWQWTSAGRCKADGYGSDNNFMDRNVMFVRFDDPSTPPGPSPYEQIIALSDEIGILSGEITTIARDV